MFDIGLFELLVVGGVGLVVIGPERLPGAIRTGALWFGRIKRSILDTRRELEQHIGADEIRRELRNEEIMASLEKLREARELLEKDIKAHTAGGALIEAEPDLSKPSSVNQTDMPHSSNEHHVTTNSAEPEPEKPATHAGANDKDSNSTEQPIRNKETGQ